jgi:hypothetical protein
MIGLTSMSVVLTTSALERQGFRVMENERKRTTDCTGDAAAAAGADWQVPDSREIPDPETLQGGRGGGNTREKPTPVVTPGRARLQERVVGRRS